VLIQYHILKRASRKSGFYDKLCESEGEEEITIRGFHPLYSPREDKTKRAKITLIKASVFVTPAIFKPFLACPECLYQGSTVHGI